MEIENYSYFLTFPASTMAWILKWITSSNLTSSFRYKIWNVFVTAVPLIIQAGKAMSEAARKCYRYRLSCWYMFHEKCVLLTLISRKTNFNFDRNFRCGFDRASDLVIPENKKMKCIFSRVKWIMFFIRSWHVYVNRAQRTKGNSRSFQDSQEKHFSLDKIDTWNIINAIFIILFFVQFPWKCQQH